MSDQTESARGGRVRRRDGSLIGTSAVVRALFEQVTIAGRERYPLWIYGEEGVERDLVGRLIHEASLWATGPFSVLDLAAVPGSLARRELFGAEAGAIQGLPSSHDGVLARSRQGTLLLDGVEGLSKDLQEEIAHLLASGRFRRLGGQADITVECRVIGCGAAPLDTEVRTGQLIRTLADRLGTFEIRIPPLRERREDVPLIAAQALSEIREEVETQTGRPCPVHAFSTAAQQRLVGYDWPRNDRELREQIRAAVALASGDEIQPSDFVLGWSSPDGIPSFREAKRSFEREYVTRLLRLCHGNISQAARLAQKDRKDFYDVMRRNAINPPDFRS
jgi:two-component system response regulator GlrR